VALPHREAVTFGQKKPIKTKAIFDPRPRHFRRPVIDFMRRSDDLIRLVSSVECRDYPPVYGLRRLRNGLINGIFADLDELLVYQRGLAELQGDYPLEYYEDGYPKLPTFLDWGGRKPFKADGGAA
jgi:hypothetical protein